MSWLYLPRLKPVNQFSLGKDVQWFPPPAPRPPAGPPIRTHTRQGVTSMNVLPSISSIKRIFFSPVDQNRIDRVREQHERNIHQLNMMNLR
jgi:hypothetical protein